MSTNSPVNIDYNIDLNLQLRVFRHSVKQAEGNVWSRTVLRYYTLAWRKEAGPPGS